MRLAFRVDGIPKGQPRARATMRGRHAGVYDPGTADGWKVVVAAAGRHLRPAQPVNDGVMVMVDFFMPRPKRLMRRRDPLEVLPHTGKPDADNLVKAVMDALTQDGWFRDDAIVFALIARKWYHRKDGRPGAAVTVVLRPDATPQDLPAAT